MSQEVKQLILKYLSSKRKEEGFTLVELIVVVVIIGILSSIAIPSFQNASHKARQTEASVLLASYVKASQAFFVDYGVIPVDTADLGQYVSVTGCKNALPSDCKRDPLEVYTTSKGTRSWISPLGYFQIRMNQTPAGGSIKSSNSQVIFNAMAAGKYADKGFGVSACFSGVTGITRVSKERGPTVFTQVQCE